MKQEKIILAGGSGFIGQSIANYFCDENHIIILSRHADGEKTNRVGSQDPLPNTRSVYWNGKEAGSWSKELEGASLVINLAGKTINCRYTEKNKKEILESRVQATQAIGEAIKQCKIPPKLWINASAATLYANAEIHPKDEYEKEYGNDFAARVCKEWEAAFFAQATPNTRKIAMRQGLALGKGGLLAPYLNLVKLGLGGTQGNGRQMYSWIHIEDCNRIIEWLFKEKEVEGPINFCSPFPVSNKIFMQALRNATGNSIGLPAYTWMIKIGSYLIGTEPELALNSRWVLPTRLIEMGFRFKYPYIEEAFNNIIKQYPKKAYRLF